MPHQIIPLDPAIFQWVLLPICLILLLVGVIRHYVSLMMRQRPSFEVQASFEKNSVAYARVLLSNGIYLSRAALKERVDRMTHERHGVLRREAQPPNPMDPSVMGDAMKKNVVHMVPNMAMMSLVSTFFSGFIMAKFPFPLADKFKGMVQRGVDIDYLDGAFATSLSLYFIIMFGLQGITKLLLGTNEGDDPMAMVDPTMAMMQQQQQGPVDMPKLFKQTAEELHFALDNHQHRLQPAVQSWLEGQ